MKSSKMHRKTRGRILTWLLVLTFVLIGGVTAFTYLSYQQAASELVLERDRQLALLSSARLKDEMSKFTDILESIARNAEMSLGDMDTQIERLQRSSQRLSVFDGGVILFNNFGEIISSVPERPEILNQDWSDRAYFRQLLVSPTEYFSNVVPDGPGGTDVVVISVPVLGARGEFIGALAGMFRLDESTTSAFIASIVRLRIGQGGGTYILDGTGHVMFDSSAIGVSIDLISNNLNWLQIEQDSDAVRTRDGEGNDVVAAYANVPGTEWILVTEDHWNNLTSTTRPYANILLVMLVLGMLLPALLVAIILRRRDHEIRKIERSQQEFNLANQLKDLLLPVQAPLLPHWNLSAVYQPAEQTGSDFHDFMFLPDGRLMITIGTIYLADLPALITHATLRAALRGAAVCGFTPSVALDRTNAVIFPDLKTGQAVECLFAILDPATQKLAYASAGIRCIVGSQDESMLIPEDSLPLGLSLDATFTDREVMIQPGNFFVLLTNGLSHSKDRNGNLFGEKHILSILSEKEKDSQHFSDTLLYEFNDFMKDTRRFMQDITLITIAHEEQSIEDERPASKAIVLKPGRMH